MDLAARRRSIRLLDWVLVVLLLPPGLLYLLLAMPIVGNAIVLDLANQLGCHGDASGVQPCYFLGTDIGGIVYNYGVGMILLGMTNPIMALGVFDVLLPTFVIYLWGIVSVLVFAMRVHLRARTAAEA